MTLSKQVKSTNGMEVCNVNNENSISMLPEKLVEKLSSFFKVLGDDTRVKIIYELSCKEMCVTDIASTLDISQSAISHQLKQLRSEGLVKVRRDGKNIYYALDDEHVLDIINIAISHVRHKVQSGEL